MGNSRMLGFILAGGMLLAILVIVLALELVAHQPSLLALVAVVAVAAVAGLAWLLFSLLVHKNLKRLAVEVRAVAHGGTVTTAATDPSMASLSPLPEAIGEITSSLLKTRKELESGLEAATARSEQQAARLAAILNDLQEGLVVCSMRHQIVLYNQVALDMLSPVGPLGLGRSLFETVAEEPVVHMVDALQHRHGQKGDETPSSEGLPFVAASSDDSILLQARISLILGANNQPDGYVLTLVDARPQVAALARREALVRDLLDTVSAPLGHLQAISEDNPRLHKDAQIIADAIDRMRVEHHNTQSDWWPMNDLYSADFFALLDHYFAEYPFKVNITGMPVWLYGDSHSLLSATRALVRRIAEHLNLPEIDLAAGQDAEAVWIEIDWTGPPIPQDLLEEWLAVHLVSMAGMTVRDVLLHHAGDAVVEDQPTPGRARLRLPMRRAVRNTQTTRSSLPRRPEFYDLSLLDSARDLGAQGTVLLRELSFVVFDTETTGLNPSQGDQMVQIGGVRVVNGRILSGESFNQIINPGIPIPPASVVFHGITDEIAKDKPPLAVVLPRFHAFARNSVLVAHNAAFDLKFLRMQEDKYNVKFNNPVLDTMMLSAWLDGPKAGHSLDDICARYGIEIVDRHTALGDAVVTAAVLLRQIDALEARGITRLDQVVEALDLDLALHQRQQAL